MPNMMGPAILLASVIAGLALFVPLFLIHAARTYLIVLTYSSTGEDRFRWPRDPFLDGIVPALPVLAALVIGGSLGFLIALPLGVYLSWDAAVVLSGLIAYVLAPICLNCMLAAPSKLLFLFPPVLGRMLTKFAGLVYVNVLAFPLFLVTLIGIVFLLKREAWAVLLVSLALPPALLLHARAWGRFMWLILNHDRPRPGKKKRKRRSPPLRPEVDHEPEAAIRATDGLPVEPTRTRSPEAPLAEEGAYDVGDTTAPRTEVADYYERQREYERRLRERSGHPTPDLIALPEPPTDATALRQKILPFLLYEETLGAYLSLFLATLAPALLVLNLLQLWFG